MLKTLIGIQARTNSSRFPRKIFETIGNHSVLEWVYDAGKGAIKDYPDSVVCVLTPPGDLELLKYCSDKGMKSFAPNVHENDLLSRYRDAANQFDAQRIIRLTSDCWFSSPDMIAEVIGLLSEFDYVSNTVFRSFMEGLDIQGVTKKGLQWFDKNQTEKREHPFYFFDRNETERLKFEKDGLKFSNYMNPRAEWLIHTSIDTKDDLERARKFHASRDDMLLKQNRGL